MLGIPASEDGIILVRSDDAANGFGHVGITRNYYDQYYARLKNVFVENGELVGTIQNTISTCPYFYYISAVGLTVGRLLHFGTLQVFLLGRLCNLLMFVLAVYYSIKKIPFGKTVLFLWALLPITLQQTMSYSYDAPILALSVVVISLSLRLAYVESEQTKKSEWVILFICTVLLFPAKSFAITPICMLPFMIYFRKHQEGKKILSYIGLLLAGMLVFAILLKAMSQGAPTADTGNLISWANEPGYTLGYLLKNPKRLFGLLCNTIYLNGDFYVDSFLGNSLGWLNLNIPLFAVIPYLVMLVLAGMRREGEPLYLGRKAKMYLCFLAVIGIGFAFAGMLLNWTPISYNWIEGVQGRYFLPFAVILFLSVRSDKITVDKQVDNKLIFSGIWLQMLVLLFLFISVC
jgi:uncharacterized membrane protein